MNLLKVIPVIRCRDLIKSMRFYRNILDFNQRSTFPETGSPSYVILERDSCEVHLSSQAGDGAFGSVVLIQVKNIDEAYRNCLQRGLDTSGKKDSPVHQSRVDQSWGVREFYVDDPDGNTIRFIMRH